MHSAAQVQSAEEMHLQQELPSLRATVRLGGKDSNVATPWYDVKFYPYTPPGVDPVFAVVGDRDTVICRCVLEKDNAIEIIRWFKDEDETSSLNSVEWSQAENGDPLVCVTGGVAQIKILSVTTGELVTTLTGHGALINDLAISPLSPRILASGSMDHSIRIWSLDPTHKKSPTAVKCGGEGHKEGVLTVAFHRTGRYLLSGGMDTIVNMWVIPDLPDGNTGTDKPTLIHYPHFSTTEIHTDFVDCARFYNDLIISRSAKENKLLLWRIDNFSSSSPPPPPSAAPIPISSTYPSNPSSSSTHHSSANDSSATRSAWGGRFQRLLQFDVPYTNLFYMRFGLWHELGRRPVLVMGNEKSKIFFWDLQKLEEGAGGEEVFKMPSKKGGKNPVLGPGGRPGLMREESIASNVSHASSAASTSFSASNTTASVSNPAGSTAGKGGGGVGVGDPFHPITAHKSIVVGKVTFATRQIAWSRGGEWAVAVGDNGMICLFRRWEEGEGA